MARVVFTWLAGALRIATVLLFPFVDVYDTAWLYSAVYWGSRPNDGAYLEYSSVRDEAHRVRDGWARGRLSHSLAREEAIRVSAELRRWRERNPNTYDLFTEDWDLDGSPCPPFRSSGDYFEVLEAQEHDERAGWFSCDYLLLFH